MEPSGQPSYEELVTQVAQLSAVVLEQAAVVAEQSAVNQAQAARIVVLERQLGRDSSNSSQPPSKDSVAAKAKAKVAARSRTAQEKGKPRRSQGGQEGHRGSGLSRVAVPDHHERVEPGGCGGCGQSLAGAPGRVASRVQVFDLPAFAVQVTEYLMMARTCPDAECGQVTTAPLPPGVRGGPTCYGPNIASAAALLASTDVIGIERAATLMSELLGATVSTGFVSSCLARMDTNLQAAGFEQAIKDRLVQEPVLGTDETPVTLTTAATNATATSSSAAAHPSTSTSTSTDADADADADDTSNPHVFTVRTMHAYTRRCAQGPSNDLVWYGAAGNRRKPAITGFDILGDYTGVLVRDDYGGYSSYDPQLAGVQQCLAHLLRYLDDAHGIDPQEQAWARQTADALRAAITAVRTARDAGHTALNPRELADLITSYDQALAVGISTNLSRPWAKGNHPGLILARRLTRKKHQVWLFTTRFDVPPTNNGSEHAVRGLKLAVKVKGCWRTLPTLQRHCRIRSYLTTTRNHGITAMDAIRDALTATPWMPPTPA